MFRGPKNSTPYSEEVAMEICSRIAEGELLQTICAEDRMPSRSCVFYWALKDVEGFGARYTKAREIQVHCLVEDMLQISDDSGKDWKEIEDPAHPGRLIKVANTEHIHRDRLRIDTRKWYATKVVPRMYGDRIHSQTLDKNGDPADAAVPVVNLTIARE